MLYEEKKSLLGWLSTLVLVGAVAACGGGGGGGAAGGGEAPAPGAAPPPAGAPDTTPPVVTGVVPNASVDVIRTTGLSVTFDEMLKTDTVTSGNLKLTHLGATVTGTLTYDPAAFRISFQPQRTLDILARYTVTASTGITDLAGNGLRAPQSWGFRTAEGSWEGLVAPESMISRSTSPQLAMDPDGSAILIWGSEMPNGDSQVRAIPYTPGTGWGSANLFINGNLDARNPKAALDAGGNGIAVWVQTAGSGPTDASIRAARYLKGTGWELPVVLDPGVPGPQAPSIAVDTAGNAMAVWTRLTGAGGATGNSDVYAARFTPAGGWEAAVRVGSAANIGTYDQASSPQVAMDGVGNAYVLWIQDASDHPVWSARYRVGTGWEAAVNVGATRQGSPYGPRLAVSNDGRAVALWNTDMPVGGPYRFDLWASVRDPVSGNWTTPSMLETEDGGHAFYQSIVSDAAGNFHAVWQQFTSAGRSDIAYRQFTPGVGWGGVVTLNTFSEANAQNMRPSIVADRNGNLMAAWGLYGGGVGGLPQGMYTRRYVAGEGWKTPSRIDGGSGNPVFDTSLAVTRDGSIAAAWMEPNPGRSDGPVFVNVLK